MQDTIICIPTKRLPPVMTLESYEVPEGHLVVVVADPDVYDAHAEYYSGHSVVQVYLGVRGMGAQSACCYSTAHRLGYQCFFRMDDDLAPGTFVGREKGSFPGLSEVIPAARLCLDVLGVTLAGFSNTSNRFWLGEGLKRTYGLIHGGANIAFSSATPEIYVDPTLARGEDVYRTCAHRLEDLYRGNEGLVGRVAGIGFNKKLSTITAGQSSIAESSERLQQSRDLILERFSEMVSCDGTRFINGGRDEIPNWRFKRTRRLEK